MPVIIHELICIDERLTLRVKIAGKTDYKLLNELFRDLVAANLCIHTNYGTERYPGVDYPLRGVFELSYDGQSGNVTLLGPPKKRAPAKQRFTPKTFV